jgi:hypothetical protein
VGRRGVVVAVLLAFALTAAVGVLSRAGRDRGSVRIGGGTVAGMVGHFPDGVSTLRVRGNPVFVVKTGAVPTVFLTDPQHLPGERALWWCPREQLFASPTHGELFSIEGQVVGGPARRGLDRFDTKVVDSMLVIGRKVLHGDPTGAALPAIKGAVSSPWDSGSSSFCAGAVRLSEDAVTTTSGPSS